MADGVKLLIVCNSGLTSTMLATRINRSVAKRGLELLCDSMPLRRAQDKLDQFDVVLLSPGIRAFERQFSEEAGDAVVDLIPMTTYGRLEAERVIAQALDLLPADRRAVAEGRADADEGAPAARGGAARELWVCCGGGFSSSLLMERVQDELERRSLNVVVRWKSLPELEQEPIEADCVLVAPQISPSVDEIRERAGGVPVGLMAMDDYGTLDAKAIVDQALILLAEHDLGRGGSR